MAFDHSKLLGRITEKYGNQKALAQQVGWSPSALSNRLNNNIQFDADEIASLCTCLDIAPEEIGVYFFTPKF